MLASAAACCWSVNEIGLTAHVVIRRELFIPVTAMQDGHLDDQQVSLVLCLAQQGCQLGISATASLQAQPITHEEIKMLSKLHLTHVVSIAGLLC